MVAASAKLGWMWDKPTFEATNLHLGTMGKPATISSTARKGYSRCDGQLSTEPIIFEMPEHQFD